MLGTRMTYFKFDPSKDKVPVKRQSHFLTCGLYVLKEGATDLACKQETLPLALEPGLTLEYLCFRGFKTVQIKFLYEFLLAMILNNGLAHLLYLFHVSYLIQKSKYVGFKEVGMLIKELIGDCFFSRYIVDSKWSEFKVEEILDKSYSTVQNGPDKLAVSIRKVDESSQIKSGIQKLQL